MRSLLEFFVLTYGVSWILFGSAAGFARAAAPGDGAVALLSGLLLLLGTIAPSLVALLLTARAEGRAGVLELLRPIFHWRVKARWYLFALSYMAAVKLVVALLHRLIQGEWPRFGDITWYLAAAAIVVSTWVQAGEEVGWRGFALPRLAARLGLAPASVVLGVIWATWHLPLFFIAATTTSGQSFPVYLLQVTALSVAMAWLYWRTGGSLLLVMLMHASTNNTKDIVPSTVAGATDPLALSSSFVAWLTAAVLWVAAAYLAVRMRRAEPDSLLLRR